MLLLFKDRSLCFRTWLELSYRHFHKDLSIKDSINYHRLTDTDIKEDVPAGI